MQTLYPENQKFFDRLYSDYKPAATQLISLIDQDKTLSKFHTFNRRFKINLTMNVSFDEKLIGIKNPDVIHSYQMMLKISDLWFAFEHLKKFVAETYPTINNSKIEMFNDDVSKMLETKKVTNIFNKLYFANIIKEKSDRQQLHFLLYYLSKNTFGPTKKKLKETKELLENKEKLKPSNILAMVYAIRNIYVHKGVAAALGSKDYEFKVRLYNLLYDTIVLYCLSIGKNFAKERVKKMKTASA